MKLGLSMFIKPLFFGFITASVLMFFELRYLFEAADFGQISPGPVYLLVLQTIFFGLVFWVATLTVKYVKNGFLKGNRLEGIGLGLLFIHLFLFLIAITYIPLLTYLNLLISIISVLFGVILYCRAKKELAIVFILWGIVIFILTLLFTGIGYWS